MSKCSTLTRTRTHARVLPEQLLEAIAKRWSMRKLMLTVHKGIWSYRWRYLSRSD
jgi:hypothetical protein